MTRKTLLTLVVASALGFGTGCSLFGGNKEEGSATTGAAQAEPPPADTGAAAPPATGDEVASYPNMVPQGGTKKTLQSFKVYQAADPSSKLLTNVGPNTLINLKGSYGNWMLIEWPCGVGKLCPGWIELRINDTRVTDEKAPPDAGTTPPPDAGTTVDAGTTPPDAGATPEDAGTAPADAGATDAGTRGRIKLFPKK